MTSYYVTWGVTPVLCQNRSQHWIERSTETISRSYTLWKTSFLAVRAHLSTFRKKLKKKRPLIFLWEIQTGLSFEFGQPQQTCQRRLTLQSMANPAVTNTCQSMQWYQSQEYSLCLVPVTSNDLLFQLNKAFPSLFFWRGPVKLHTGCIVIQKYGWNETKHMYLTTCVLSVQNSMNYVYPKDQNFNEKCGMVYGLWFT